jgi:alkaline phosphatase D
MGPPRSWRTLDACLEWDRWPLYSEARSLFQRRKTNVARFYNEPLKDMAAVGMVTDRSCRIWLRSDKPGTIIIRWKAVDGEDGGELKREIAPDNIHDNCLSILLSNETADAGPLRPATRFKYEVRREKDDAVIGSGDFETAPSTAEEAPKRHAIALMSCNLPIDKKGRLRQDADDMMRACRTAMDQHNVKSVMMVGDQMYADYPDGLSLYEEDHFRSMAPEGREDIFECSEEEARALFQLQYRYFWNVEGWKAFHQQYPSYPILDDHEVVDNWGSAEAHEEEPWLTVGRAARAAYMDYQGGLVQDIQEEPPPSFHYSFTYANTATFVMDIRSERRAGENGQLYSDQQQEDFERFLKEQTDKDVLFMVLSVPAVHLPRFLARVAAKVTPPGEDFSDRWSSGAHLRDRDRFLKIVHDHQVEHPKQKIVLLSGDIHIACVHRLDWRDGAPPMYQVISSGVTNYPGAVISFCSKAIIRMNNSLSTADGSVAADVELVKGSGKPSKNPFGGLNMGLVEVERSQGDAPARIRFVIYGHEGTEPKLQYASDWL